MPILAERLHGPLTARMSITRAGCPPACAATPRACGRTVNPWSHHNGAIDPTRAMRGGCENLAPLIFEDRRYSPFYRGGRGELIHHILISRKLLDKVMSVDSLVDQTLSLCHRLPTIRSTAGTRPDLTTANPSAWSAAPTTLSCFTLVRRQPARYAGTVGVIGVAETLAQ